MATRSQRRSEQGRPALSPKEASRAPAQLAVVRTAPRPEAMRVDCFGIRGAPLIPTSLRLDMIRDAAYFRAQARGFAPGEETDDWLAAEQEIDELIVRRYGG
jgi:Protein of unknown function (DUF2934)